MKTLKKTLSLVLCVCILASVAAVATFSASANAGDPVRRPVVSDIVNSGDEKVNTNTYYFYMPEAWRNVYNDRYDGVSLDSCVAGIYWWEGAYNSEANHDGLESGWPGYAITKTDETDKNIFVVEVPESVSTIIFNNTVDGGANKEDDPVKYVSAIQTANIGSEFYSANEDGYGFYPNGTETFNNMIYVCNPKAIDINDFSGKETYNGVWFYYYGNGKYGIQPTLAEAEAANAVYSNGEFPPYGFQIDSESLTLEVGKEDTITPNDNTAVATVADSSIATITQDAQTGKVTVKGVKAGTTKVTFTLTKDGEVETLDCTVTVKAATTVSAKAKSSTIYVGGSTTITATVKNGSGKTTYKSDKTSVATVSASGKVTAKKAGTANITVTNNGKSAKVKITVKNPTIKINKTKIKVKKTAKITTKNTTGKVKYKSSKSKVAKVSAKGVVTGVKKGTATITVTATGYKKTFKVTVTK